MMRASACGSTDASAGMFACDTGEGQARDAEGGSLCAGNLSDLLVLHDP
jgi:hypothetical protein